MYKWIVLTLVLCPAVMAAAQLEEDAVTQLQIAFETLAREENLAAADDVMAFMNDPGIREEDWRQFFLDSYDPTWFTPPCQRFWTYAVGESGMDQGGITLSSGYCAAATTGRLVAQDGFAALGQGAPASLAVHWLRDVAPRLGPAGRASVFGMLDESLASRQAALAMEPGIGMTAVELYLTLGTYAAESPGGLARAGELLQLDSQRMRFPREYGLFVIDGGALSGPQLEALDGLLAVLPLNLARIAAILVAGAVEIDPGNPGIQAPGQLVFIDSIPLSEQTDPEEFSDRVEQPTAPAFICAAAQAVTAAIQEVQLQERPELRVRLQVTAALTMASRIRCLRRTIPPEVVVDDPSVLLPAIGYVWVIDTRNLFRMALDRFGHRKGNSLDQFLLFADLMSGGGNTAPLYKTSPQGRIGMTRAPVERSYQDSIRLPEPGGMGLQDERTPMELSYISALGVDGALYSFAFGDVGDVSDVTRR